MIYGRDVWSGGELYEPSPGVIRTQFFNFVQSLPGLFCGSKEIANFVERFNN